MILFKKLFNKKEKIFIERFNDKKVEPLFLCEKRESFLKRLIRRKDFIFLRINDSFKYKYKKIAVLLFIPIITIAILTGGICISLDKCNKHGTKIFNQNPQIVKEINENENIELLLALNKPEYKEKKYSTNDICKYKEIKCNKIIIENLENLILSAKKEGYNLKVLNGYIDENFRENEYKRIFDERLKSGCTYIIAEAESKKAIFRYYENETGLSVNISNNDSCSFDFINSNEYKWLIKNCIDFGFVLRAPQGKEGKTGMDFDPTFFRYVGVHNAKKMRMLSMCLEDYRNYLKIK